MVNFLPEISNRVLDYIMQIIGKEISPWLRAIEDVKRVRATFELICWLCPDIVYTTFQGEEAQRIGCCRECHLKKTEVDFGIKKKAT